VGLDQFYAAAARTRRAWYERHPEARRRLRRPVISIGNLSVGGTGKTPLVAQIAWWLIERGERPAILSRGYKRRTQVDGVTVVSDGATIRSALDTSGDEPMMLAREVAEAVVCVADDRHLAGVIAERVLGATVHLLDDGFQHVALARDFDILVTSTGEIVNGRVIPHGRLREARDAAARANFAVFVGADEDTARTEAWDLGISAYSTARRTFPPDALRAAGAPAVAVAGIGRPEQFVRMLRDAGVDLKGTLAFADHHHYTLADVARITAELNSCGAQTVWTTAKDAVRLEALGRLPFPLHVVAMRLELQNWNALAASLDAVLARVRRVA
jgi:tetraacyldisaccharide 4'-kinase